MSRWFRYYDEALNDPKVQSLPGKLFKTWVNLLCVASKHDGKLPPIHELTYLLRVRSDRLRREVNALIERGLIDAIDDGMEPHNWWIRQYKSDNSAARVKRFRERQCNVTEAVTVTPPESESETETETETETEKKDQTAIAAVDLGPSLSDEEEFWSLEPAASKAGITRSRLGQLVKLCEGNHVAALTILKASLRAKTPSSYLAKTAANLKAEQGGAPPPVAAPIDVPDFVRAAIAEGSRVEKHPNGWKIHGAIYSNEGAQLW